ncbi:hypothetical protein CAI21_19695 [Alkalilimnicola ehrlichii]|uniref:Uncharacterized protein n=1 Tax=Alkalilimnicola ehrlichii TaxID=351052 RepID=A0A3E0WH97_9GAMM|nr:ankyrin repeat domain-containing protein [Alkalilimnicola ehrlichii]RFA25196.1 hypothetical protein CAI21_19695 [Alkalilimnicola ehrlichii]RFA32274.1 hypothetical protein CAL65_20115 [Alkalilimnicola ehrlichii]
MLILFCCLPLAVSLPAQARVWSQDLALSNAVEAGDLAGVEAALEQGAYVDAPVRNPLTANDRLLAEVFGGGSPLIVALMRGDDALIDLLLERGANPDLRLRSGVSPLFAAAWSGHARGFHELLRRGADISVTPSVGGRSYDLMVTAVSGGSYEIVETLLAAGVELPEPQLHRPLLELAVQAPQDNMALYALLRDEGVGAKILDPAFKRDLLQMASRAHNGKIVSGLIERGAGRPYSPERELELIFRYGGSALLDRHLSGRSAPSLEDLEDAQSRVRVFQTSPLVVVPLVEHGYVELAMPLLGEALEIAVQRADEEALATLMPLLEQADLRGGGWGNLLIFSILTERDSLVDWILAQDDPPVNASWQLWQTPLTAAIHVRDETLLTRLLALGANPEPRFSAGRTPMRVACEEGFDAAVPKLLEAGVELRLSEERDQSLARCFMASERVGAIRSLLEHADDVTQHDVMMLSLIYPEYVRVVLKAGWGEFFSGEPRALYEQLPHPLVVAAERNRADVAQALLESAIGGDRVPLPEPYTLGTLLEAALFQSRFEMAQLLHEYGARLDMAQGPVRARACAFVAEAEDSSEAERLVIQMSAAMAGDTLSCGEGGVL